MGKALTGFFKSSGGGKNGEKRKERIIAGIVLFIFAFVFSISSPLHIWIKAEASTDSSVFKTVALMMENGYMPYRDSFDHKGPLIYLINFLGMKIAEYRGVWVIELVSLWATFLGMYKTARLKCGMVFSWIAVLIAAAPLFEYFQNGNFTEEYAMPWIAFSLYFFLDYLMNQKVTAVRLVVCGLGFGAVCLLRPNMISVWAVFCVAVLVYCIRNKDFAEIKRFILYFLAGFCLLVIPVLLWLIMTHSFHDFLFDYFYFNLQYTSPEYEGASFAGKWMSFFTFFQHPVIVFSFLSMLYFWQAGAQKNERFAAGVYVIYLLVTLWMICLSGMAYGHYGMILVPAAVFPAASLCGLCSWNLNANGITLLVLTYWLGAVALPGWLSLVQRLPAVYQIRNESQISGRVLTICDIIQSHTSDNDRISVYGNWDIIYVLSSRMHATRYSYQFPIGEVMPEIMTEYMEELRQDMPKILVVQEGHYDERIAGFLNENQYSLLWSENETMGGPLVYQAADTQ